MAKGVYEGEKPYIFISYSHKDSARVLPLIEGLLECGFRVWYDEGIEAGTEWPAYIEKHLEGSAAVVVFLSDNSIQSVNCRNEVNVAAELGKEVLVAQLDENVTYQHGMRLQLSSRQKIFCYRHNDNAFLLDELMKVKMLEPCLVDAEDAAFADDKDKKPLMAVPKKTKPTEKVIIWVVSLVAILVIAIVAGLLIANNKPESEESTNPPRASATATGTPITEGDKPVENEEIVMSDDLFDFTFELNGEVYKLPCAYETFAQKGWTISTPGYNGETIISGESYEAFHMAKDGCQILLYAYNLSGNSKKTSDCKIGGIEWSGTSQGDFKIAKGITIMSTPEQIKEAFGTPNENDVYDSYESIIYNRENDSYYSRVKFYCDADNEWSSIELKNFVKEDDDITQTNPAKPEYLSEYKEPTSMGEDLFSLIFSLDGDLYQLPVPLSCFLDNEWVITSQPGAVVSGKEDTVTLKKDGYEITLSIINLAEYQTIPENCVVSGICAQTGINIVLPNKTQQISIGMSKAELDAALPEGVEVYEGSYSYYYTCWGGEEQNLKISIVVDVESKQVSEIELSFEFSNY